MRFGKDIYGRYVESGGFRSAVERFPLSGFHPVAHFDAWFWIGLWKLSNTTGARWQDD